MEIPSRDFYFFIIGSEKMGEKNLEMDKIMEGIYRIEKIIKEGMDDLIDVLSEISERQERY